MKRARTNWPEKLASVAKVREPFLRCAREILGDLVPSALTERGPIVEVGAGSGELRRWLEGGPLERWIHTEPDGPAFEELEKTFPEATVKKSAIEELPFDEGEVGAVVGLCVFDLLPDLPRALREVRRVLATGGKLVHLLDLTPHRAALLEEASGGDKLAFPNVFGDPLDEAWPQDLLVTDQKSMRVLLDALERIQHPLPSVFRRYFDAALGTPFDAERAATELDVISRAEPMRALLRETLRSAYEVGYRLNLEPPVGKLVASGLHFAARLHKAAEEAGFSVAVNEIRTAWSHEPALDSRVRHRVLCLGQMRLEPEAVAPRLCEGAQKPPADQELRELGMLVFVASAN